MNHRMLWTAIICLWLIFIANSIFAFAYEDLVEAYSNDNFNYVIQNKDRVTPQKSYYFIVGRSYYKLRHFNSCQHYFNKYIEEEGALEDYAYYYLGMSNYYLEQYVAAAPYFIKIIEDHPDSRYLLDAVRYLGNSYINAHYYTILINRFKQYLTNTSPYLNDPPIKGRFYFFIGVAKERQNKPQEAIYYYYQVYNCNDKELSSIVIPYIEQIDPNYNDTNDYELRILLGIAYYKIKQYNNALTVLKTVPIQWNNPYLDYKRLVYIAHCYQYTQEYSEAMDYIDAIINRYPNTDYAKKATFYKGEFYKQRGYHQSARQIFSLIVNDSIHPYYVAANGYMADYYISVGHYNSAIKCYKVLAQAGADNNIWALFLDWINNLYYTRSLTYLPQVADFMSDAEDQSKMYYWLGVIACKKDRYGEAQDYLIKSFLSYRHSFYSYRAWLLLNELMSNHSIETTRTELLNQAQQAYQSFLEGEDFKTRWEALKTEEDLHQSDNKWIRRGMELLSIGENRRANEEFLQYYYQREESTRYQYMYAVAKAMRETGGYNYSISWGNRLIAHLNHSSRNNYIPEDVRTIIYPTHYREEITEAAQKSGLNNFILYAVIREESRFVTTARSWCGAMGLMQLMPATARDVARGLNINNHDYYNININITLGATYLADLIKRFEIKHYALGGYNGGPTRIRRLMDEYQDKYHIINEDHFMENLSIAETRNYIRVVLQSYYCYLDFYYPQAL